MKRIRLNSLVILFLVILIVLTFSILSFYEYKSLSNFKRFTLNKTKNDIQHFVDFTFTEDIKQQAYQLNTEIQGDLTLLNLVKTAVEQSYDTQNFLSINPTFVYDKKNEIYRYSGLSVLTQKNLKFGFYISYWGKKDDRIFIKAIDLLNRLTKLRLQIIQSSYDPNNAIVDIFVLSKDKFLIQYTCDELIIKNQCNKEMFEKSAAKILNFDLKYNTPFFTLKHLQTEQEGGAVTICVPVYNKEGKQEYVIGATLASKDIIFKIYDFFTKLNYHEYNLIRLLIDNDNDILYLPYKGREKVLETDTQRAIFNTNNDVNTNLPDKKEIRRFVESTNFNGDFGKLNVKMNSKEYLAVYQKLPINKWTMVVLINKNELFRPLVENQNEINETIRIIYIRYILAFVFLLLGVLLVSYLLSKYVFVRPIEDLREEVSTLGKGNFDHRIKERGIREIFDLSKTFNLLSARLKEYTSNLAQEIKERQVMETELEIAGKLQDSVLPEITDDFKRDEFELYANLLPAKEMSGDFYDFFYVGNDKLVLVIADVSGKGITAAFYMSMAKAIIKEECLTNSIDNPGKIIEKVNNILCNSVKSVMFLTLYLVVYDIKSGVVRYSNAGHHGFIKVNTHGEVEYHVSVHNTFVGFFHDIDYGYSEFKLEKGEILGFFTDGIIDAVNKNNELFGIERLQKIFAEHADKSLVVLGDSIFKNVLDFQSGDKSDDITLVILRPLYGTVEK